MRIKLPLPCSIVKRLVALAAFRCGGRRELRTGAPNICRLTQLAVLGAIARLVDRLLDPVERLSSKRRRVAFVVGAVLELGCIAGVVFCFWQLYTSYDRSDTMMATGAIAAFVAALGLLVGLGLALRHLVRFCPFEVPAITQVLANTGS